MISKLPVLAEWQIMIGEKRTEVDPYTHETVLLEHVATGKGDETCWVYGSHLPPRYWESDRFKNLLNEYGEIWTRHVIPDPNEVIDWPEYGKPTVPDAAPSIS